MAAKSPRTNDPCLALQREDALRGDARGGDRPDVNLKMPLFRLGEAATPKSAEGEGNAATIKWAFGTNSLPELRDAQFLLKTSGGLRAAGVLLDFDSAPRSKAAKELENMALKQDGGRGEGAKKEAARRSAELLAAKAEIRALKAEIGLRCAEPPGETCDEAAETRPAACQTDSEWQHKDLQRPSATTLAAPARGAHSHEQSEEVGLRSELESFRRLSATRIEQLERQHQEDLFLPFFRRPLRRCLDAVPARPRIWRGPSWALGIGLCCWQPSSCGGARQVTRKRTSEVRGAAEGPRSLAP
ncbi:unnamed protein product, partial [Prorocentrum cordatum]